jgi:hypothetical protein
MSDIDIEEVWADFSAGKIESVANTLGTTPERALQQVGNQLVKESDELLVGIWRYSFDVIALAFLFSLIFVFVFVARQSFPHGKSNQAVITAAAGIPKYHVITDKDVALQNVKTIDGSLGDLLKVLGHYAVEPIPQGATVRSNELSSRTILASTLQGRQVLVLPIRGPHFKASELPVLVSLYISPKTTEGKQALKFAVIRSAYILSSGVGDPGWAATALTAEDANTISALLGNADIYASENAP